MKKENSPLLGDCELSEGTSSPPPQGFCLQDENTKFNDDLFISKTHIQPKPKADLSLSHPPLRACFLVVLRQQ